MRWGNLRRRRGTVGGVSESSNGEGSVEVLLDLGDYPIRDGPSVDPGDGTGVIAAFDYDGGSEGGEGEGVKVETEGVVGRSSGEKAHQKLVRRGAVEPPFKVGSEDSVNGVDFLKENTRSKGKGEKLKLDFCVHKSNILWEDEMGKQGFVYIGKLIHLAMLLYTRSYSKPITVGLICKGIWDMGKYWLDGCACVNVMGTEWAQKLMSNQILAYGADE
ncbi:hypothetical protein V6N11_028391 [Hibiscus sabdariffa]|uniref:Uncharacterized protein n=1 Tax=Hibiscus sabdariffa TaxID=183260 RepID=A0ABR2NQD5_9ROSI